MFRDSSRGVKSLKCGKRWTEGEDKKRHTKRTTAKATERGQRERERERERERVPKRQKK